MYDELYHYGVKGMKWGVRKKAHNSSNRSRKKEIKKEYYKTPEGRIKKATIIGDIKNIKLSSVDKNVIKKGRNFMQSQNIQQQINQRFMDQSMQEATRASINAVNQAAQINQRFMDQSMQEATRASINAANQAASLAMTGGMNPFMFGMM